MKQQVKLVVGSCLNQQDQQFCILKNQILGKGAFGQVKKAYSMKDKSTELAVKIIPYDGDPKKRQNIEKQISILRLLPEHQNLVKVLPIKCFSPHNIYIFMECCEQGTLLQQINKPGRVPQQRIIDIFYQLVSGYRVLYDHSILHQDLKLMNVLVKNGSLKITDFGFSILNRNCQPTQGRCGTRDYMPLQKLRFKNYINNPSADIYALGVMMFQTIAKKNPYVNQTCKDTQQYIQILINAPLYQTQVLNKYSAVIRGLFELVVRMIDKRYSYRATCQEVFAYVDSDPAYAIFREKDKKKDKNANKNKQLGAIIVTEVTQTIVVPFTVAPQHQQQYVTDLKEQKLKKIRQQQLARIAQVQAWVMGLRLVVYYFDRMARRLLVEKLKRPYHSKKVDVLNQTILGCLLLQSKVIKMILKQIRSPNCINQKQMRMFRESQTGQSSLKIIKKDEEYVQELITDNLKITNQISFKTHQKLIQLSKKQHFSPFVQLFLTIINKCIEAKSQPIQQYSDLVTLVYLIDSIGILNTLPLNQRNLVEQQYFYKTETMDKLSLLQKVLNYLNLHPEIANDIDEELYRAQQPLLMQEDKQNQEKLQNQIIDAK